MLAFTDKQLSFQQLIRKFVADEVIKVVPKMENGEFPKEVLKVMGNAGLLGIPIPKVYGGQELDFISYTMAIHEISKVSPALGVILSVHTSVGTNPILRFGTDEQKQRYVTKLSKGAYLGAFALTEPNAGSDAASLKTTAERKEDHYIVNGSKIFITNGGEADTYIMFAKTNRSLGSKGITAFIVEKNMVGFHVGKDEKKMGLNGSRTVQLHFENMKIPVANRLGNEGEGFKIAMANLDAGRIGIAAQSLGIAEGALYEAKKNIVFTEEKENILQQGKLADMETQVEAARLLVYRAAHLYQQGMKCTKQASMAKLFASQAAMNITTEAIQLIGLGGATQAHAVERLFRDAKVCEIYEGTSEIQRIVISKSL
ncbi:acyl-CoA dehydrogenase [Priestia aryabhattai]|uniref:acyl-CoA dehydrogenase family protein n=1 Tax=Priestia flexa TaxID=86664 RepID=UPI000B9FF507|nr:acyl-CoA dehydrogenase [Priestia aryabhattai]